MKKTWFVKYIIAFVISLILAFVLARYAALNVNIPVWLPYVLPLVAMSLIAIGGIIKTYVMLTLEEVRTSIPSYNVLFKAILIVSGFLLLVPLLIAGVILCVYKFFHEFTQYRNEKKSQSGTAENSEEENQSDVENDEKDIEHTEGKQDGANFTGKEILINTPSVTIIEPQNVDVESQHIN